MNRFFLFGVLIVMMGSVLEAKPQDVVKTKAVTESKIQYVSVQNVKLRPAKGGLLDLSYYKGKVVVINFFATWCPPCLKELPEFVEMQKAYQSKGVQFIGVCVDGSRSEILAFAKTHQLNYPVAMDNQDLTSIFGDIQGVPTTFLIDRNQRIVDQWVGYKNRGAVEEKLRKWL